MIEEAKEKGNPVLSGDAGIPAPPIPSKVKMSMVPKPPERVERMLDNTLAEEKPQTVVVEEKEESEMKIESEPKGTILVKVYENFPFETEFSGKITGAEIDIAIKAVMKGYRVWKHNVFNKKNEEKKVEVNNE